MGARSSNELLRLDCIHDSSPGQRCPICPEPRQIFSSHSTADFNLPSGQCSCTYWVMSAADSFGEKRNSFVFPETKINRRLIWKNDTMESLYNTSVPIENVEFSMAHCKGKTIFPLFQRHEETKMGCYSPPPACSATDKPLRDYGA